MNRKAIEASGRDGNRLDREATKATVPEGDAPNSTIMNLRRKEQGDA